MENRSQILTAKGISIGYPLKRDTNTIANNITITLKEGQLTALVGANGIGKSTLLRTLTGLQKPLTGDVLLYTKNIAAYSAKELAQNLSIVLTEALPPSNLSVYELIALGRQPYTNWLGKLSANDLEKVDEAMKLTQLAHLADKKHYEISDGQLQKVLIARALAQDTPLIVLDEPTTHLDLLHKAALLKLLKKLTAETGKSILYSTHDIDLALQISDEVIVMAKESVIQDSPEKLLSTTIFDTLFNDSDVVFDAAKKGFIVR